MAEERRASSSNQSCISVTAKRNREENLRFMADSGLHSEPGSQLRIVLDDKSSSLKQNENFTENETLYHGASKMVKQFNTSNTLTSSVNVESTPQPSTSTAPSVVTTDGRYRTTTTDAVLYEMSASPSNVENDKSLKSEDQDLVQSGHDRFARSQINHEYNMDHGDRGWAYIFNQETFNIKKLQKRYGTQADVKKMKEVLEHLGFNKDKIVSFQDSTKKEIDNRLDTLIQEDHTDNDCVVVVFLTHGKEEGVLYAKDKSFHLQNILAKFQPDSCKSLLGKPKIFIIQACRGEKPDEGIQLDGPDPYYKEPLRIPKTIDFLVCYSCSPKYASMRNTERGTWYIQVLGKAVLENMDLNRDEFTHVLTSVNRQVSLEEGQYKGKAAKQCSAHMSTLLKLLYFRPYRVVQNPFVKECECVNVEEKKPKPFFRRIWGSMKSKKT